MNPYLADLGNKDSVRLNKPKPKKTIGVGIRDKGHICAYRMRIRKQ